MKIATLDELTQFLKPFHELHEANTKESVEKLYSLVRTIPLPPFFTLRKVKPVYKIDIQKVEGEPYVAVVFDEEGNQVNTFNSAIEAYHWAGSIPVDVHITGDITAIDPSNTPGFVFENNQWLIETSDTEANDSLRYRYLHFLFATENYYKDPSDFYTAYRWVTSHPTFWFRATENDADWMTTYTNYDFSIGHSKSGDLVYMLETGAAIGPQRLTHYHDLRLDVYAPSFEEAFIKLAALVDKFFDLDGEERENVTYVPSELERLISERLKDADTQWVVGEVAEATIETLPEEDKPENPEKD